MNSVHLLNHAPEIETSESFEVFNRIQYGDVALIVSTIALGTLALLSFYQVGILTSTGSIVFCATMPLVAASFLMSTCRQVHYHLVSRGMFVERAALEEKGADAIGKIMPCFRDAGLRMIGLIPRWQRNKDLLANIFVLLKDLDYAGELYISQAFGRIYEWERADVITQAAPFLKDIADGAERVNLLEAISYSIDAIFSAVQGIPEEERADVIDKAMPFLKDITDGHERADILWAIGLIPRWQRNKGLLANILVLFKGVRYGRYRICQVLKEIPEEKRADVIDKVAFLLKNLPNAKVGKGIAYMLETMKQIPEEERADVIDQVTPLFKDIADGYERADILWAIGLIPREQRSNTLLENILVLFKGIDRRGRDKICWALKQIPAEERADIIAKVIPLLKNIPDGKNRADALWIIDCIPRKQRDDKYINNVFGIIEYGFLTASQFEESIWIY